MGYTSNVTSGSPMDPGVSGGSSSLARLSLFARVVAPRQGKARAAIDLSARGHGVTDDESSDVNYAELSARPGALIGWKRPLLLAWRAERLYVDDDPSKFYDANRLEVEFDAAGLAFVAGGGKRRYRNPRRPRWEVDGGLGRSLRPSPRSTLLLAGSLRFYDAEHPAYDQRGATLVTALRMPAGPHLRDGRCSPKSAVERVRIVEHLRAVQRDGRRGRRPADPSPQPINEPHRGVRNVRRGWIPGTRARQLGRHPRGAGPRPANTLLRHLNASCSSLRVS
jgi:hypothetical protein